MRLATTCTPKARQSLKGGDLLLIAEAEPKDYEVEFGYSDGWTAKIRARRGGVPVGEAYHYFSIRGALTAALKDMRERVAA